jgi:uncharacterized protein
MPITALYAAILAGLFLILSARVIGYRQANKVSLGDGDSRDLLGRIRAHANCAEYAPLGIVMIGLLESLHAPALGLHGLGGALVLGRVLHAYGISLRPQVMAARVGGMVMTLSVLALSAVGCLWLAATTILK